MGGTFDLNNVISLSVLTGLYSLRLPTGAIIEREAERKREIESRGDRESEREFAEEERGNWQDEARC